MHARGERRWRAQSRARAARGAEPRPAAADGGGAQPEDRGEPPLERERDRERVSGVRARRASGRGDAHGDAAGCQPRAPLLRRAADSEGVSMPPGWDAVAAHENANNPAARRTKSVVLSSQTSERGLLSFLLARLQQLDADVIVGHNIAGFDLDVLLHRLQANKVPHWSRVGRLKRARFPNLNGGGGGGLTAAARPGRDVVRRRPAAGGHLPRIARVHQGRCRTLTSLAQNQLKMTRQEVPSAEIPAKFGTAASCSRSLKPPSTTPGSASGCCSTSPCSRCRGSSQHRGRDVVQDAAAHARRARRAPAPARVPRPQVSAAGQALGEGAQARARRLRRRRGRGRRRGEGWQEEGRPRVRGRARARAEEGQVRQVRADAGLQLAVPVHHPGVRHLLHHRGAPQARPRRPRRGAAAHAPPSRPPAAGRPQRRGPPAR